MSGQVDRQMPITQIDELWAIAEARWGSAGRRVPAPDPRFAQLREYLAKVEALFAKDKENRDRPHQSLSADFPKKKGRKIAMHGEDDGERGMFDDDEIPF